MQIVEKTGATVEEAIAAGLKELGVEPTDVMVEVLEEPDQGIMGEGARPARVKLLVMRPPEPPPMPTSSTSSSSSYASSNRRSRPQRDDYVPESSNDGPLRPTLPEVPDAEADELALVGREILSELVAQMGMDDCYVSIHRAASTQSNEADHWVLNISGSQVNRLIGRRGDTLASLQYLLRLMVSRRIQSRTNLIVDVAEYKARRSDRLSELANRMADQALRQNRTITLEPMPPHERRIIHMTLRNREGVTTKSIGEGDSRKVTISPEEEE